MKRGNKGIKHGPAIALPAILSVGLLLLLLLPACRKYAPLVEYQNVSISSGSGKALGLEDIKKAIAVAATEGTANWQLSNVEPGSALATLHVRNEYVMLQIFYTENTLSMVNASGAAEVRSKYNKLVSDFLRAIQRQLARM